ncbi:sugar transporter [Helicobacter burdigaliensis]|uniref:sugar transporter n=1 Tax=Helicobacter burdigaliensis TaxID=2315334 RepID=UPI000EF6C737|nr:sugar transporter [Helicobacter burdigaliensis]
MQNKENFKMWLGVIAISLGAFILNTSEFVPVGLLSLIADDFNMKVSSVGLMVGIYAYIVALVSLPLMMLFSKMELRSLMLLVLSVFVISHIFSSLATNYEMLLASRIGVALSHALFWSIATPMAVRIIPQNKQSLALSLVVTGTAIAFIGGIPLGRVIGLWLGWRISFLCIGILALLILMLMAYSVPKLPSNGGFSIRLLPKLLSNKALLSIYMLTILLTTAHFVGYTYIEEFLKRIANFSQDGITLTLVAFGAVGFLGSFLFTKYYDKNRLTFSYIAIFGITLSLFALEISSLNPILAVLICVIWGLCITIFNLTFQSKIIHLAPHHTSIAMSMFSGIYNIGIGSGAFVGRVVIDGLDTISFKGFGVEFIGGVGGIIALLACLIFLKVKKFSFQA